MRVRTASKVDLSLLCEAGLPSPLFGSSVSHATKNRRPCDASRLPRWLVWCYVLSDTVRQESRICRLSRPQKRRIRSLRNKRSACGRPLVAQRSTGQQKSAALARRRGARHIDARPGFPAGHRRRRGAGGLSDTVVQRTVHANGVAPVWPGGVASIASRVVASRYTPLLIWLSDAWSRR